MTIFRSIGLPLLLLLLLAGCASPARRIEQNQAFFDTLPVAAQTKIRDGQVDLGFPPAMTRIALGEPQRKLVCRTPEGTTDIWLYIDTVSRYERQRADIDGMSYSGPGGIRSMGGSAWINVLQEKDIVRIRAEFKNGVLAAIEEPVKEEPAKKEPKP